MAGSMGGFIKKPVNYGRSSEAVANLKAVLEPHLGDIVVSPPSHGPYGAGPFRLHNGAWILYRDREPKFVEQHRVAHTWLFSWVLYEQYARRWVDRRLAQDAIHFLRTTWEKRDVDLIFFRLVPHNNNLTVAKEAPYVPVVPFLKRKIF